jgi:hypothetical protein
MWLGDDDSVSDLKALDLGAIARIKEATGKGRRTEIYCARSPNCPVRNQQPPINQPASETRKTMDGTPPPHPSVRRVTFTRRVLTTFPRTCTPRESQPA